MSETPRKLTIGRRFSLAGVGEGWQDCYLLYRPATARDKLELQLLPDLKDTDPEEAHDSTIRFLKDHFVTGQGLVGTDLGKLDIDVIEELPDDILGELYLTIMGVSLDPKVIATVKDESSTPSVSSAVSSDESDTKTP